MSQAAKILALNEAAVGDNNKKAKKLIIEYCKGQLAGIGISDYGSYVVHHGNEMVWDRVDGLNGLKEVSKALLKKGVFFYMFSDGTGPEASWVISDRQLETNIRTKKKLEFLIKGTIGDNVISVDNFIFQLKKFGLEIPQDLAALSTSVEKSRSIKKEPVVGSTDTDTEPETNEPAPEEQPADAEGPTTEPTNTITIDDEDEEN